MVLVILALTTIAMLALLVPEYGWRPFYSYAAPGDGLVYWKKRFPSLPGPEVYRIYCKACADGQHSACIGSGGFTNVSSSSEACCECDEEPTCSCSR